MLVSKISSVTLILLISALAVGTSQSLKPIPDDLSRYVSVIQKNTYLDRYGKRLNVTYQNRWNIHDAVKLHQIPEFLIRAFIRSEDKRFYQHSGIDWLARLMALKQNMFAGKVVRGASTISEQVVRMIHPRPRTFWSRWLEGFEAAQLEAKYSKLEILEFYLNQVPYKSNRRGIVQAARLYFERDITTLNDREMLALTILIRSPQWFDPIHNQSNLAPAIKQLSQRLNLSQHEITEIQTQQLDLHSAETEYDLSHFIQFADSAIQATPQQGELIHTTLDLQLQLKVQNLMNRQLNRLQKFNVSNAAVLVVDHESNEILSWVVGHAGKPDKPFNKIDALRVQRQPGSALKPLLYASAIDKGWNAATMLDDAPLEEGVGLGMHRYQNYSRHHYGLISLREALGNSLNIPAVKTLQYVGAERFLIFLHDLGIQSLAGHPNVYGDGLALGNGELQLYELVQAYTVLARMGDFKPITFIPEKHRGTSGSRVLSEDVASLIADILSDPTAREKEFGWDSILNFPQQTAVKTGTSSDYRDAWALGYNDKYTVGVWMGNQDYSPMNEITGSSGPALTLRSVFNELNKNRQARPLYLSRHLINRKVCIESGQLQHDDCKTRDEWFIAGREIQPEQPTAQPVRLRKPSKGLMMAMDPRIPDDREYFEFSLNKFNNLQSVNWFVNDRLVATTLTPTYLWKLQKGFYNTHAEVTLKGVKEKLVTGKINYRVK